MHDNPAAFKFAEPDGQSKVQKLPLHLLGWLYALHMRKCESHIISCDNLQPFDIECNRLGLAGIEQLPSIFVRSESARLKRGTSNIRKSREWFATTSLNCLEHSARLAYIAAGQGCAMDVSWNGDYDIDPNLGWSRSLVAGLYAACWVVCRFVTNTWQQDCETMITIHRT